MKNKQLQTNIYIASVMLVLFGSTMALFDVKYAVYVFGAGALGVLVLQFFNAFEKRKAEMRSRRLARTGFFNSILLPLATYIMYINSNSWIVFVLAYAISSFFLTYRGSDWE